MNNYKLIKEYFPLIDDIEHTYKRMRRTGVSRDDAINNILDTYSNELNDRDDSFAIWLGLASVLGLKKELRKDIMIKATDALSHLEIFFLREYPEITIDFKTIESKICDKSMLGNEARYPQKKVYRPGWKKGDTFEYLLSGEYAAKAGLNGWSVLLRKIGEEMDIEGNENQIMYMTVCPSSHLPHSDEELVQYGLIPWFIFDDGYAFLYKLLTTSKKRTEGYALRKIGCFPKCGGPKEKCSATSLLLLGNSGKAVSDIEIQVCRRYVQYGIHKGLTMETI